MGEAELIKQCMRGVNAARKELYDTYAEQMLSICFRYTCLLYTSDAADD